MEICIRQPGATRRLLFFSRQYFFIDFLPPIFFHRHFSIIFVKILKFVPGTQERPGGYFSFHQYFFIDFLLLFWQKFGNLYPATRSDQEATFLFPPIFFHRLFTIILIKIWKFVSGNQERPGGYFSFPANIFSSTF